MSSTVASFLSAACEPARLGDRSFAMDPLASQGVQAALRSAVQASAVIHTILSAGDTEAAIEFYREAQREAVSRHRRTVAGLYSQQRRHLSSFWHDRSQFAAPTRPPSATPVELPPERRVRLSSEARIADLPVIDGAIIRRYPTLSHPALDRPVAWLGPVSIGPILSTLTPEETVASLVRRLANQITENVARQTLNWLLQRDVIVDAPL
jgi:hypothetical protein